MANVKLGTKAVGSVLKLNLNGSPKNFIVVHQGKPSSLYDDSCDGTWLLMQGHLFHKTVGRVQQRLQKFGHPQLAERHLPESV